MVPEGSQQGTRKYLDRNYQNNQWDVVQVLTGTSTSLMVEFNEDLEFLTIKCIDYYNKKFWSLRSNKRITSD